MCAAAMPIGVLFMLCALELADFTMLAGYPTLVGIGGAAVALVALLGAIISFMDLPPIQQGEKNKTIRLLQEKTQMMQQQIDELEKTKAGPKKSPFSLSPFAHLTIGPTQRLLDILDRHGSGFSE